MRFNVSRGPRITSACSTSNFHLDTPAPVVMSCSWRLPTRSTVQSWSLSLKFGEMMCARVDEGEHKLPHPPLPPVLPHGPWGLFPEAQLCLFITIWPFASPLPQENGGHFQQQLQNVFLKLPRRHNSTYSPADMGCADTVESLRGCGCCEKRKRCWNPCCLRGGVQHWQPLLGHPVCVSVIVAKKLWSKQTTSLDEVKKKRSFALTK